MRILLALAMTMPLAAQTTVLSNMTLFDGTGAPPRQHVTLVLSGGKIQKICDESKPCAVPLTTLGMDLANKFVMPSLISAHAHLALLNSKGEFDAAEYTASNVVAQLMQYERYGVTAIASLGANRDLGYDVRDQQRAGKIGGATMLTVGRGMGVPDGMPPFKAAPDQLYKPATPEEARKDIQETATHHADLVKIWVDSGHGKMPEMQDSIIRAIVDESHKHNLRVAAHVYALEDARRIVNMGVDILAHSVRDKDVDDSFIALLKQKHIWYIPTLTVDESFFAYADHPELLNDPLLQRAVPPEMLARLTSEDYRKKVLSDAGTKQHREDLAIASRNLKKLYDAGVQIGFGTDSGAMLGRIPGYSEHRELALMVAAGLTPAQAIACATSHNAKLLHLANTGVVKEGESADLLVLDGDPTKEITNTTKIAAVFHHGVRIER